MEDEKKNITVSFLIGAAIGAGVAYFVSDSGRKKTPELYDYIKKSLDEIAKDPQKTLRKAENEVVDKAVDIKDSVAETIESIKTIGTLNLDKLIPRDFENVSDESKLASSDNTFISQEPKTVSEVPKKTRRFFKKNRF